MITQSACANVLLLDGAHLHVALQRGDDEHDEPAAKSQRQKILRVRARSRREQKDRPLVAARLTLSVNTVAVSTIDNNVK